MITRAYVIVSNPVYSNRFKKYYKVWKLSKKLIESIISDYLM